MWKSTACHKYLINHGGNHSKIRTLFYIFWKGTGKPLFSGPEHVIGWLIHWRTEWTCDYHLFHLHGPMIAYFTSKGCVEDYIKKYLDKTDASEEIPSWNDLKRIYKKSIRGNNGPPTRDSAWPRQNSNESVQLFAQRFFTFQRRKEVTLRKTHLVK